MNIKNNLAPFLFGVLLTLILFGFILPLFPNFKVSTNSEFVSTIVTLFSSFVALGIATWGARLKELGDYRSDIKIIEPIENIQVSNSQTKQGHTRLKFENIGRNVAEDVEVYIDKIYDNGKVRDDFISVPLTWTHSGAFKRSFQERQYGYLDLCRRDNIENELEIPKLVLTAGAGVSRYQDIVEGDTVLRLLIFQKNEKRRTYKIHLNWIKNYPYARVTKIVQVI